MILNKVTQPQTFSDMRVKLENEFHVLSPLYTDCEVTVIPQWNGQQAFEHTDPTDYLIHIEGVLASDTDQQIIEDFKTSSILIELHKLYGNAFSIYYPWEQEEGT